MSHDGEGGVRLTGKIAGGRRRIPQARPTKKPKARKKASKKPKSASPFGGAMK